VGGDEVVGGGDDDEEEEEALCGGEGENLVSLLVCATSLTT
jgi:hypothetical protein